ncbi:hypothetical protein ACSF86_04060 [Moraxella bovoculi]|uniref:hypothetical protein n=1 Tax=Moraxella bovoculi TaxID=386891 RepID=UPI003F50795F
MNVKNTFSDYQKLLRIRNKYIAVNVFVLIASGFLHSSFGTKLIFYMSLMVFCGFFIFQRSYLLVNITLALIAKELFFGLGKNRML